jgi:hypothetical protein
MITFLSEPKRKTRYATSLWGFNQRLAAGQAQFAADLWCGQPSQIVGRLGAAPLADSGSDGSQELLRLAAI